MTFDQIRTVKGGLECEWAHVDWYYQHPKHPESGSFASEADLLQKLESGGYYDMIHQEDLEEEAMQEAAHAANAAGTFAHRLSPAEYKTYLAYREFLRRKNYVYEFNAIQFKRYPEDIYNALVEAKAWSPGAPRVETDLDKLGYLG